MAHITNGGNYNFGGRFDNEVDAAKRINQLCEKYGIEPKNPELCEELANGSNTNSKISKYNGVSWDKEFEKWRIKIKINGKYRTGGVFVDEFQAAKRLNQLCVEYGIEPSNPQIKNVVTEITKVHSNSGEHCENGKKTFTR